MSRPTRFLAIAAFAFIVLAFTACDENDEYYYSPLIGDWVLVADDYGPVEVNQSTFNLYADGSGIFTDYDEWGYEYTYNIFWQPDGTLLYITFNDGTGWTYRWAITGSTLFLTDVDTGSQLTYTMY